MEENAVGGVVVTAPTCGACGIVPAVLRWCQDRCGHTDAQILDGLAIAGVIGNLVKRNASISGAEVGCQGEVGTACAMAAAAACHLMGGSPRQCEYAAEMALEHHLGLTCDPVLGLVQAPCIERNAFAALRAVDCADYARTGDGTHRISFDHVVQVMAQTGRDLPQQYRETSRGGLATVWGVGS
jgi:L-serine dehydratase